MNQYEDHTTTANHSIKTDMANPPKLADLKENLLGAKDSHDNHVAQVQEYLNHYYITGSAKRKKVRGRSNVQPRVIMLQAEWRVPGITEPFLNTPDIFKVNPATAADVDAARQNEALLNYQFNTKINKVKFIDKLARTLAIEGSAILRTGWNYRKGLVDVEKPQYKFAPLNNPKTMAIYEQIAQQQQMGDTDSLKQLDPALLIGFRMSQQLGSPVEAIVTGYETVKENKVIKNEPTIEVCNYDKVVIDPLCEGDLDKANFIIFEFDTCLSDLKKETSRYTNLDKIEVENQDIIGSDDATGEDVKTFNYKDRPSKEFIAYEYWGFWDIDNTGITEPFVATWVGNTMIRLERNPFPDKKLPFVLIHYLPDTKRNYGKPDGELIRDNQHIIGAITRGMIDIVGKAATGQRATRANALDLPNKRKFDQGLDFEFQGQQEPERLFHIFKFPEIPQSAPMLLQQQHNEAESLTGVKAFASSGVNGASLGETATGVRGALDAASKREISILRRISEGLKEAAQKVIAMNSVFLSEEEVVRVTDEDFIFIRRDDLAGNFDLVLQISTAEADNAKAEELAFMLQTGAANADPEEVRMIRAEIADLRKMPALAKKIREFQPQPDPLQVKKQELEIQLLEAQIQNEMAKAHENNANGELDLAKVNTEQAKAQQLRSQADKLDLDYVEQETGTKQERDKEIANQRFDHEKIMKKADMVAAARGKAQSK
jgi:hypothetical protein